MRKLSASSHALGLALMAPLYVAVPANPALAQSAPAAEGADAATVESDIIVTARRRSETAIEVPAAITALGMKELEKYNSRDFEGLQKQIPGLIIADFGSNSGGSIALRGISSSPNNPAVDQTVSINVDNVQIGAGAIIRLGQFDLQQVEVLKGPQALFFGKNSTAGVLSLRSADPGDAVEIKGSVGYEVNARDMNLTLVGSGPLTDTLGVRLAVSGNKMRGWLKNDAQVFPGFSYAPRKRHGPNQTDLLARMTLLFKPNSDFTVRAKYSFASMKNNAQLFDRQQRIACPYGAQNNGYPGVIDCKADNRTTNGGTDPRLQALLAAMLAPNEKLSPEGQETTMHLASIDATYEIAPDISLNSVSAYFKINDDFGGSAAYQSGAPIASSNPFHRREISQEVRLTTSREDWPVNFTLGGYYQDTKINHDFHVAIDLYGLGLQPRPGLAISPLDAQFRADGDAISFFGQAVVKPIEDVEIAGGARWLRERKSVDAARFGVPKIYAVNDIKFTNTSPEVTIRYRPSREWTFFGAWRNGFKSGGFNESAASTGAAITRIDYRPETIEGFEAGAKFANGTISGSVTAYTYKYTDLQVSTFDPATLSLQVSNAAGARIKGIEGDIAWRTPVDGLQLRASANYNKATYTSFIGGCYTGQTIAEGCNLVANPANGRFTSQNLAGRPLVLAPEWTGTAGFTFTQPVGNDMEWGFSGDILYSSSFFAQLEEAPLAKQAHYANVDASLHFGHADGLWKFAVIGRNLTEVYRSRVISQTSLTGIAARTGTNLTGGLADYSGAVNRGREVRFQFSFKL